MSSVTWVSATSRCPEQKFQARSGHPKKSWCSPYAGDRPELRLVEAMPFVLATKQLRVGLALAFAAKHDPRVRTRLGWLSDITLTLGQLSSFPVAVRTETALRKFAAVKKSAAPDSLGHPGEKRPSLLWRRWNITYSGDLDAFVERARELTAAGGGE